MNSRLNATVVVVQECFMNFSSYRIQWTAVTDA